VEEHKTIVAVAQCLASEVASMEVAEEFQEVQEAQEERVAEEGEEVKVVDWVILSLHSQHQHQLLLRRQ
jgi:hypothetical protein